ncbi:N,N-dimethylformamidase beta subunit family domain-containing protein [Streptomyces sp. NPDC004609]|uniref:N,N-dimethylformamidase beta subunit family domain-containing protein n=1 Tax=Streptomyces sp. NPDC004609 TaxID=3364704 RepID=UPI0036BF15EC
MWLWTARPARGSRQVVLSRGDLELFLDGDGTPAARVGETLLTSARPLDAERWTRLGVTLGPGFLRLEAGDDIRSAPCGASAPAGPVTVAASGAGHEHFTGKIEELRLGTRVHDVRALRLVNGPTLAVTGRHWQDDTTDFRSAPAQYAAVHFHEDDVEDAGFTPTAELTVPDGLPSGVYAFRVRDGAGLVDHVPFTVTPPRGTAAARIGFLLPTLTYLAYANERLVAAGDGGMVPADGTTEPAPADRWLAAHPEAGLSVYDKHTDGSGCSLVSLLRPIPNLRPDFVWWNTGAPERFGADLYIADFLDHRGEPWDAFTDHDLHEQGAGLLARYPVIVTGTHPEYSTREMLLALESYLDGGGRVMYLGGNGFYWVTSIDPDRPHLAEVRRGINGTRAWNSRPGETRHQTTGEPGGLWRYRDRPPHRLTGVGFAAQSDGRDRAPGYRRTPAAQDPAHAWIFDGVSDAKVIGDYGLSLGGAAGYEIDRYDPRAGSPAHGVVLMTSQGLHPDSYLLAVEDLDVTVAEVTGSTSDRVRSDVVHLERPGGGAVFSVGSCSWAGSLSHNGYDNDIARITDNVLTGFLHRATP